MSPVPLEAPTTNLFLKSGVPPVPSQRLQPFGILFSAPDQIIIPPEGKESGIPLKVVAAIVPTVSVLEFGLYFKPSSTLIGLLPVLFSTKVTY